MVSSWVLALVLSAAQLPTASELASRPRSILAPSLPQLTLDEEKALDGLISRFAKADIGTLTGAEATQAIREFQALGMESVPALIRGLNRAVEQRHACPTLQISRKLTSLLGKSADGELLEFARDNIGAGVREDNPYLPRLKQMRTEILLRRNALAREAPARLVTPPPKPTPPLAGLGSRDPKLLSTSDLAGLARTETNEALKAILRELDTRRGPEVAAALGGAVAGASSEVREMLQRRLAVLDTRDLLAQTENTEAEVRRLAVERVLDKHPELLVKIIDRVADRDESIRQTVRTALARIAKSVDFGPEPNESDADARKARDRWRTWWELNQP